MGNIYDHKYKCYDCGQGLVWPYETKVDGMFFKYLCMGCFSNYIELCKHEKIMPVFKRLKFEDIKKDF